MGQDHLVGTAGRSPTGCSPQEGGAQKATRQARLKRPESHYVARQECRKEEGAQHVDGEMTDAAPDRPVIRDHNYFLLERTPHPNPTARKRHRWQ